MNWLLSIFCLGFALSLSAEEGEIAAAVQPRQAAQKTQDAYDETQDEEVEDDDDVIMMEEEEGPDSEQGSDEEPSKDQSENDDEDAN